MLIKMPKIHEITPVTKNLNIITPVAPKLNSCSFTIMHTYHFTKTSH